MVGILIGSGSSYFVMLNLGCCLVLDFPFGAVSSDVDGLSTMVVSNENKLRHRMT